MNTNYEIANESFNISKIKSFLLVMHIGQEDAHLIIVGIETNKKYKAILKQKLKTNTIHDVSKVINDILEETHRVFNIEIATTIISAEGTVSNDRSKIIISKKIEINKEKLKKETLIKNYVFLNASEATGAELPFLTKKDLKEINNGDAKSKIKNTASLKISATLTASINKYDNKKQTSLPIISNMGKTHIPTETYFDLELNNYIRDELLEGKQGPISTELIVSEKGICLIYDFLISKKVYGEPLLKIKNLDQQKKAEKIITTKEDTYCVRTTDLFLAYLARTARELATLTLPYGGLYIEGKIITLIQNTMKEHFMKEFLNSEIKENLKQIPIYIIEKENVPYRGACDIFLDQQEDN